jgi:signal transduction histidine kinase
MPEPTPDRKRVVVQQNPDSEPFEVYHLSHDLRGPLNSILGFTELLLEEIEGPLTDIQKEDILAINQSAQNLLHLINTMVDLSKFDAGRMEFNLGEVALDQVVNTVLASDF